jgi:teichuronic acid biosynthesis glycosyltransferase TuaC
MTGAEKFASPHIVVFSSLFPNSFQPMSGLFIRERMFRVGQQLPISVVAPVPWFPFQSLIRRLRPDFRPKAPGDEVQKGVDVFHPRYLSIPGAFKSLDGILMALCCLPRLMKLKRQGRLDILDAHFAYPDGYAAALLGLWLKRPVTITLRGTETRHLASAKLKPLVRAALSRASRVFSVSDSLRQAAISHGAEPSKIQVVGNGVDISKFSQVDRQSARAKLGLMPNAKVIVTVGGLVERKGFHRVIAALPEILKKFPDTVYLIIGGASAEGDWTSKLQQLVAENGLGHAVKFLGLVAPEHLSIPLSAADVFVLSTRNEGWANVLLEAMACGLPVVATDVGGNSEVVCRSELGKIVPFDDHAALVDAIEQSLTQPWDKEVIRAYAHANTWDSRVATLTDEFRQLAFQSHNYAEMPS